MDSLKFSCFLLIATLVVGNAALTHKRECLKAHNMLRKLHKNTPLVRWDAKLAAGAQQFAKQLASEGQMYHSYGDYGENLYYDTDENPNGKCSKASLAWYNEIKDYSYSTTKSSNGSPIGHFTQLIWRSTTKIGVGIAEANGKTFVVARYLPKGNFVMRRMGESSQAGRIRVYTDQVKPRKPGSVTPTLYQIKPSLCVNNNAKCANYVKWWTCEDEWTQSLCPKMCKVC